MRKVLRIAAGVGMVLIGIVGLIMPVMPGWIFIIPGLVILAEFSPRIQRLLEWARRKFEETRGTSPKNPSATIEDRPDPGQ